MEERLFDYDEPVIDLAEEAQPPLEEVFAPNGEYDSLEPWEEEEYL